jgi:CRP/FNR family cyclic AMP-dependent transcriptional regulator
MWGDERQRTAVRERFKGLLASHRAELAPVPRQALEGELLLAQGDRARSLLLLTEGQVAIQLRHRDHSPHTLTVLEAEELLGEMGLFGDGFHSADVRVVGGPAQLIEVESDAVLRAMLFDADLAMAMLTLLSQRCQYGNAVIGLLLDAITTATHGDGAALAAITERLRPLDHSLAAAAAQLVTLSGRRSAPAG